MDSAPPFERKKRAPELYVQPATTPRASALCDPSPVCDYLSRNSWMKSDPCRGDDRRSLRDVVTGQCRYHVRKLFLERTSFDRLFRSGCARLPTAPPLLGFLPNSAAFRKRARSTARRKWILLLVNRAQSTIVSRGNSRSRLFNDRLEEL